MSVECDVCGEYSDYLHPVSFISRISIIMHKTDENEWYDELTWNKLRLLEMSKKADGDHVYLCRDCFSKNKNYIVWWG